MPKAGTKEGAEKAVKKAVETRKFNKQEVNRLTDAHETLKKQNEQLQQQLKKAQDSEAAMEHSFENELQQRVQDMEAKLRDELAHDEETYQIAKQYLDDENSGDHDDGGESTSGSVCDSTKQEAEYSARWLSSLDNVPLNEQLYYIVKRKLDFEAETLLVEKSFKRTEEGFRSTEDTFMRSRKAYRRAKFQHKIVHMQRQALPKYGQSLQKHLLETIDRMEEEKQDSPGASSVTLRTALGPSASGLPTSLQGDFITLDANSSSDSHMESELVPQPKTFQELLTPGQKKKHYAC